MTSSIGRICLMLAGSALNRNELRQFFQWIESVGSAEAQSAIDSLRRVADNEEHSRPISSRKLSVRVRDLVGSEQRRENTDAEAEVADKVERLLLAEAGLTKARAIELLSKELKSYIPNRAERLPNEARTSFRVWVEKLARDVPYSALLHMATKIRNDLVHPRSDWPLRKE